VHRPPLGAILRIFFVSTFVGTFLPSVGGDLVRAYDLSRHGVRGMEAGASVLMDRFLGALSILIVAAGSLAVAGPQARQATILPTIGAALACAVGVVVLVSDRAAQAFGSLLEFLPWRRLREAARRLLTATRRYVDHRGVLANVTIGSIAVQVLRILQAYCIGRALHVPLSLAPLSAYFALIPLILLITLVPVTVNGLGTSQVAFVWLFGTVGVAEAPAFALSVLFVALGAIGNLPGGLIYAFGDRNQPEAGRTL
jgi:uncharacterized protein (TIRG00374 family)